MNIEPTADDVEDRYPDWRADREPAPDGLCHARRITPGAALSVKGDTWQDVLDDIRAAEGRLHEERPWPWR